MRAQPMDRQRVANAEIDAEVDVACFDAIHLEPIGQARRRANPNLIREGGARAVPPVAEDPRRCRAVCEPADPGRIRRPMEKRRLPEVDTRGPRRLQIPWIVPTL